MKLRRGNWSGTGAGKTLSAVLASRISGAQMTLITCPNNVIDTWKKAILNAFPDSEVAIKTFQPNWRTDAPRYLVLNYEAFQRSESPSQVQALLERERLDMVVVDEVHFVKQRSTENLSWRKEVIQGLLGLAAEANPELRVLGMSATPVVNNLQEGKSLIELITGIGHDDLQTRATLGNCVRMFQQLSRLGLRWIPDYGISIREHFRAEDGMVIDCPPETIEAIRQLPAAPGPLAVEQLLTPVRLTKIKEILANDSSRPTLLYSQYIDGIGPIAWPRSCRGRISGRLLHRRRQARA